MEWAVIPIHCPNLISPTVPSHYTLPPTTCVQALAGGQRDDLHAGLRQGSVRQTEMERGEDCQRKEGAAERRNRLCAAGEGFEHGDENGKCQGAKRCRRQRWKADITSSHSSPR